MFLKFIQSFPIAHVEKNDSDTPDVDRLEISFSYLPWCNVDFIPAFQEPCIFSFHILSALFEAKESQKMLQGQNQLI
jgi:hypothetical protein